jgi:iron(III) transport system permease protein
LAGRNVVIPATPSTATDGRPAAAGEPDWLAGRWRVQSPFTVGLWALAALTITLVLIPPAYLLMRALQAGDGLWPLVFRERTVVVIGNTILLAVSVGIGGIVLAVPLAWLTTRTDLPLRRVWQVLAPLPLVIPSYAGALAVIGMLGPRGLLQGWLEPLGVDRLPDLYGFPFAAITLILFTYPYIYLPARAALLGLDASQEEAALSLGRGRLRALFGVTLPQLRPAVGAGTLLAVLYAMSDFGVVTLMRYDVLTRVIYTQYRSAFDRTLASALAVILIGLALVILFGEFRMRRRAAFYRVGTGAARQPRPVPLGRWRWPAFAFCILVAVAALGVPILTLVWWMISGTSALSNLENLPGAIGGSLTLALLAAVATTLAALPISILGVRRGGRVADLFDRLSYVGWAVPGIALALAFVFIGARYLPGLYQTMPLLIVAMAIRHLAQSVGASRAALLQVSPRLEDAARTLGRHPLGALRAVTLPLAWPGIATGALLVAITVLKELPMTLLLAPTGFGTIATEIWTATGAGQYGRAATAAVVLIMLTVIPTLLLNGRTGSRTRH